MRVLVVEHDAVIAEDLTRDLRRHGHEVKSVDSGAQALKLFRGADMVLLDFALNDLDGLEVCRGIRTAGDTHMIAVTAPCTELDRVLGLQAGLDDYLMRPFGLRELLARMDAVTRRVRPRPLPVLVISRGPLRIDVGKREVRLHDEPVELTRKEFQLLHLLASHHDAVVSRKRIMSEVWHEDRMRSSRTIDTHVNTLRQKLGAGTWIVTVRGVGFRLGCG
ncbi:response regulator transcription factor [Amycolatopsis sp. lyj-109]|uniref:response regulator transcription factor n=1 Tax=Amycolatopsis sp. lyj-109 TaxID=2789287 RepID=UPI0039788913